MGRLRLALVGGLLAAGISAGTALACRLETFLAYGISFRHPGSWHVTTKPLSTGSSPDYRFAIATWPARRTPRDRGPCLAGIRRQRPADGALMLVREEVGASRRRSLPRVPPRPDRFPLPTPADGDFWCLGRGSISYVFEEHRRVFYLGIALGLRASSETRRELRRILASLEIRPLRDRRPGTSRWSDGAPAFRDRHDPRGR